MHVIHTLLNTQGVPSADIWGSFCVWSSLLSVLCHRSSSSSTSLDSVLFAQLKECAGLHLGSLPSTRDWNSHSAVVQGSLCSPCIRDHGPLLSEPCVLKTIALCILSVFWLFQGGRANMVISLLEVEVPLLFFKIFFLFLTSFSGTPNYKYVM